MRELAEALAKCKELTTCKLSQNAIKLAGAKAVAKMLPECKQLERFYISFTEMGDEGQCVHSLSARRQALRGAEAAAPPRVC